MNIFNLKGHKFNQMIVNGRTMVAYLSIELFCCDLFEVRTVDTNIGRSEKMYNIHHAIRNVLAPLKQQAGVKTNDSLCI